MFSARYIPNFITGARIIFVPCLIWMLFQSHYERALILVLLMGLSDALDGFLARCYDWKTTLGSYLDPIADKVMLLSAYLTFAILGWVPWWLSGLIIARDVVLLIGAVCYHLSTRQLKMDPLALSKINTFAQIILAVSLIYAQVGPLSPQIISVLITIVACTTLASGSQYVVEWSRRAARVSASRAKL